MPYPGYRGYCYPVRCLGVPDSDTLYIAKHNGIVYFHSVNSNPVELAKTRPLADLQRDLTSGRMQNFSYVMPDECHDTHGAPPVCVDSGNAGDVNDTGSCQPRTSSWPRPSMRSAIRQPGCTATRRS